MIQFTLIKKTQIYAKVLNEKLGMLVPRKWKHVTWIVLPSNPRYKISKAKYTLYSEDVTNLDISSTSPIIFIKPWIYIKILNSKMTTLSHYLQIISNQFASNLQNSPPKRKLIPSFRLNSPPTLRRRSTPRRAYKTKMSQSGILSRPFSS